MPTDKPASRPAPVPGMPDIPEHDYMVLVTVIKNGEPTRLKQEVSGLTINQAADLYHDLTERMRLGVK